MKKSTKNKSYRGFTYHFSPVRGCYMIFHTNPDCNGYFVCGTMNETITETKSWIDHICKSNNINRAGDVRKAK